MSAFLVNKSLIVELAAASPELVYHGAIHLFRESTGLAHLRSADDPERKKYLNAPELQFPNDIAACLADANERAMDARYPGGAPWSIGPVELVTADVRSRQFPHQDEASMHPWAYYIQQLGIYEYQASDLPEWFDSTARKVCVELKAAAGYKLAKALLPDCYMDYEGVTGSEALASKGTAGPISLLDIANQVQESRPGYTPDAKPGEDVRRFTLHEDAGHGWLEVPRRDLVTVGLNRMNDYDGGDFSRRNGMTAFSYQSRELDLVYLEEDCDGPLFMERALAAGWIVNTERRVHGGRCYIRELANYAP